MNLYKKLWSKVGGRPWTYIIRDLWTQVELMFQLVFYGLGVLVCYFFGWQIALITFGIYTLGFIGGHLWWGTKHVRGQRGK